MVEAMYYGEFCVALFVMARRCKWIDYLNIELKKYVCI